MRDRVTININRSNGGHTAITTFINEENGDTEQSVTIELLTLLPRKDSDIGFSVWVHDRCVRANGEHAQFIGLHDPNLNLIDWRRMKFLG